jgi:hypothetical protein
VQEVGNFLVADKGMAPGDVYALASIARDMQLVVRTRLRSQGAHVKQPWTTARWAATIVGETIHTSEGPRITKRGEQPCAL